MNPTYQVYQAERRLVEAVISGQVPSLAKAWREMMEDIATLPASRLKSSTVRKRVGRFVRQIFAADKKAYHRAAL